MDDNVRFYLTLKPPEEVPADGLYVYEPSPGGPQLECLRIGAGKEEDIGKPISKPELNLPHLPQPLQPGAYSIPINQLLYETRMPGDGQRVFISLERINQDNDFYSKRVSDLSPPEQGQGLVKYEFPHDIRQDLCKLSWRRHETIYCTLVKEFQSNNKNELKPYNATPCWRSLKRVSQGMIEHLAQSLRAKEAKVGGKSYDNLPFFSNPEWVFQLHRTMVEGVAEGHESVTKIDSDYVTHPGSTAAWKAALDEAGWGWTWDNNNRDLEDKDFDAYEAIRYIAFWYRWGLCDELFDWVIPGDEEAQEYCFLRMHYAHWYLNLLPALINYGVGRNTDWKRIIYPIIMHNFASPPEGADHFIVSNLGRLSTTLATSLERLGPLAIIANGIDKLRDLVIDRVMTDLRQKAAQQSLYPPH